MSWITTLDRRSLTSALPRPTLRSRHDQGYAGVLDLGSLLTSSFAVRVPLPVCEWNSTRRAFCPIRSVPFRGVNCSDAAGNELDISKILGVLRSKQATTGLRWDANKGAPFFNAVDASTGEVAQYRFDDARSLAPKYSWARAQGLAASVRTASTCFRWGRTSRKDAPDVVGGCILPRASRRPRARFRASHRYLSMLIFYSYNIVQYEFLLCN